MIGPSKSESILVGDGPRAHGEDVTQYAADTSGCALVRFYVGRVVVTLHLEDGGLPIADIYHARILAGPANYLGARDRKSVGWGKSVSVRVDLGGRRLIKQKKQNHTNQQQYPPE